MFGYEFYVDPSRCIGCRSCLQACEECDTHRGKSMINFDFIERKESIRSAAYVCWHCDEPTCAQVCPADAIKKGEDGIVHSSLKPRCIACNNCVLACPFGIPKMMIPEQQMMKCDMRPEEIANRREKPTNIFYFGSQKITTKVYMMAPAEREAIALDVVDYMWEENHELVATRD